MISADPNWLIRGWRLLRFRWSRTQLERELAEEIEFHRSLKQAENRRSGLSLDVARALSCRQMGNMTIAREECREMWSFVKLEKLLKDIRYGARILRRSPGFTAVAVLSLALGIGGNAAMFSIVNVLLVRPLPYLDPGRLVRVTGVYPRAAVPFFQQQSRTMEVAAVGPPAAFNLTGNGPAIRVPGCAVSANLLSVLGASVERGRGFARGEDVPGRDAIVILSDSLWKAKFGGDPSVIGRVIAVNGMNREIVGIMPPDFSYPSSEMQMWVPLRLDSSNFLEYWGGSFVPLVGRLKPGASYQQASGETQSLNAQFMKMFPYPMRRDFFSGVAAIPLQEDVVGNIRNKLIILLASVGIVLLIACTNVASLLLSRATARRKEIALRTALGAGRLGIVRQLLTESILLAVAGAALGVALGMSALSIFKSVLPSSTPGLAQTAIDWQVAAAVAALTLLTGLAFGIAPALSASQIDLASSMRTGSQRSTGAFRTRLRSWLIGAEVALTVVLVISAGLLIKSLQTLSDVRPGFEAARILTVRISPNQSFCRQRPACIALYDRLLARAREIPEVAEAALVNVLPLDGAQPNLAVDVEGHPRSVDYPSPLLWSGAITPGYLHMMGIPLLAGRDFTPADGQNPAGVLLISAATAKHFWPSENPIGKHIKTTGEENWRTVVGVVGDVRQFDLSSDFPDFIPGAMYMPYPQAALASGQIPAAMTLLVKARNASGRLGREIRMLAQDQDPNVPVGQVTALEEIVAGSISDFRSTIRVFISFAGAAILLAAIGIYGLVSYWVSQRTFEIGVRVAIGATRQRIVSMILGQGLRVAGFGTVAGIAAALLATRSLKTLLFGVTATDPLTFAA